MTPRQRWELASGRTMTPRQRWERSHPSLARSDLCRPMGSAREQLHWRMNRRRWLRRHDVWQRRGPLPLFVTLCRMSKQVAW